MVCVYKDDLTERIVILSEKYFDIVPGCRGVVQCPGQQVAEAELHRWAGGEVSLQDEEPDDE